MLALLFILSSLVLASAGLCCILYQASRKLRREYNTTKAELIELRRKQKKAELPADRVQHFECKYEEPLFTVHTYKNLYFNNELLG